VTIDNTADPKTGTFGSIQLSGNGSFSLSAPTTATAADPFAGVVLFQPVATRALSISGNAVAGLSGTVLAPAAQLAMSGNGQFNGALVVDTLTLSGTVIANVATLSSPTGTVAYSPAQIRTAYGMGGLGLDGTGQTIAIVVAYDDPSIYQSLDAFDSQFGVAATGNSLYEQYGPASAFLTVLNQAGQTTNLPATDPAGPGTANWEAEAALDVEWAHAVAPGAQIILVEANSQSLPDLMAGVSTASAQPGVSVVSMSWGFKEGLDALAQDEAAYDGYFTTPGITYVASTGDYGTANPEYPAFSPNVVAVGGTSLTLNADGSYNSETGWGYQSASLGEFVGSGGGISQYEAEPAYQVGVQSTGYRTTPDVSFVADPLTGAWVADPYNLVSTNPWEVSGGTSLSAPCWAGLIALADQGRVSAGQAPLGIASPTDAQKALYSLPLTDFHDITSGTNGGYNAGAGYDLVTGLGSPAANLVVPGLIAYNGQFTIPAGETPVNFGSPAPLTGSGGSGGPENGFSVYGLVLDNGPARSGAAAGERGSRLFPDAAVPAAAGPGERAALAADFLMSAAAGATGTRPFAAAPRAVQVLPNEDVPLRTSAMAADGFTAEAAAIRTAAPRDASWSAPVGLCDTATDVDMLFASFAAGGDLGTVRLNRRA
jgi:subtilase family serine protease